MRVVPVLVALAAATAATGCSSGTRSSDKAGGSNAPVVLRLADNNTKDVYDGAWLQSFANRAKTLSGGSLRIEIVYGAAGDRTPATERRVVSMVRSGEYEFGWVGSRVWDQFGVPSFRALQAPFLITDYRVLNRVVTSKLAKKMLAGLEGTGVVGVGLLPDYLRYPISNTGPLASLRAFRGTRIRVIPSQATEALMRALGAIPVHVANADIPEAFSDGRARATEGALPIAPVGNLWSVPANLPLYPKTDTLIANPRALDRLDGRQRAALAEAVRQTLRELASVPPPENAQLRAYCDAGGRIVFATPAARAEIVRSAGPVRALLAQDPQTSEFIRAIQELKASTPRDPALSVPAKCRHFQPSASPSSAPVVPASLLNGTYRYTLTRADAVAFGPPATNPDNTYPGIVTWTLRDGTWLGENDHGTYRIRGNRITTYWPSFGYSNTFTFTRDPDGTIHWKPVLPMDRGDQFVWAWKPWRRIGPPIRK